MSMTFQEIFSGIKEKFARVDVSGFRAPIRIQIDLVGEAAGVFSVEVKGGVLRIEPQGAKNSDVRLTISDGDFLKILEKKLDPMLAWTLGKLKVQGDFNVALELKKLVQ